MEVYYHVLEVDKQKCIFNFSYIKDDNDNVVGKAVVNFEKSSINTSFDTESNKMLTTKEKNYILDRVLKHIEINSDQ